MLKVYFKRGIMPDEINGKDSEVELNIENLTSTGDIYAKIELQELKYYLSKKENHFEDFFKSRIFYQRTNFIISEILVSSLFNNK